MAKFIQHPNCGKITAKETIKLKGYHLKLYTDLREHAKAELYKVYGIVYDFINENVPDKADKERKITIIKGNKKVSCVIYEDGEIEYPNYANFPKLSLQQISEVLKLYSKNKWHKIVVLIKESSYYLLNPKHWRIDGQSERRIFMHVYKTPEAKK